MGTRKGSSMKGKLFIIGVDGTYKEVTIDSIELTHACPKLILLEELLEVPHLHIEHVTAMWQGKRAHMFVHDEGKLIGLPRNPKATAIYYNIAAMRTGKPAYNDLSSEAPSLHAYDYIAGPAALWTGDME
jgi:hypothetical protein